MTIPAADVAALTLQEFDELLEGIKRWGAWGAEDQRGALNLITPEHRARAAALVADGTSVSLSRPLGRVAGPNLHEPATLEMYYEGTADLLRGVSDRFTLAVHGLANTHLDALCHVLWRRKMWNGFGEDELTSDGALRCGIEVAREGIVSRGVLLDMPRVVGRPYLEAGESITAEDLERAEAAQGVQVSSGDVLLVRTGRAVRESTNGEAPLFPGSAAGLHLSTLRWLSDRGVALLGGDGTSDCWPSPVAGVSSPIHVGTLVMLGIHLLDSAALEALAGQCAARQRWEFLFALGPLVIEGATGCAVNPVAVF